MEELSTSIDQLLSSTNIQSHHYGIPKINYHLNCNENALYTSEYGYYQSYKTLLDKLNQLIYLNEIKQLSNIPQNELQFQYDEIMVSIPANFQSNPLQYLESQNKFKTNTLLNKYLEITLPILRSIHHSNHDLTSTETIIQRNLQRLYSMDHKEQDVNINKLITTFNENQELNDQYNTLTNDLSHLFETLKPKLAALKQLDQTLGELEVEANSQKVRDINMNQHDEPTIKKQYKKLIQKWTHISILCDFLPNFIMCLPINWFEDLTCRDIIEICGDIREQFSYYQTLINKDSISTMSVTDLLMIDLEVQ